MKTITALLALAGSTIAFASPVSAAEYLFTGGTSGEPWEPSSSIIGSLVTDDVESAYKGYYFVQSVTLDLVSFYGMDEVRIPSVPFPIQIPYAFSAADVQFAPAKSWLGFYNPETQDFIGTNVGNTSDHAPYASGGKTNLTLWLDDFAGGGLYLQTAQRGQAYTNLFVAGSGTGVGDVPEPATWAIMIGGIGLAGGALRRRKASLAFA